MKPSRSFAFELYEKSHCISAVFRPTFGSRKGVVTVEMALTVSLAFFFFFAALEFTRVSMMRHCVENALYEGGRQGIIPGSTASEVQATAASVLRTIGITGASISVTPSTIENSTREIAVRIQLPLDRGLFTPAVFFAGKTLDRTLVMRREGVQ